MKNASAAMNARPVYLQKQPFAKRAQAVRRAISRVAANPVAEEILAVYLLECRQELPVESLDTLPLESIARSHTVTPLFRRHRRNTGKARATRA